MAKADEKVLCVRRALFDEIGAFQGLNFEVDRYLPRFLDPANNLFVPRSEAEDDPSFKQLIPYAVLTHEGRILHYIRGGKGGEKRLVSKGSIGIGGHINDLDAGVEAMDRAAYKRAVEREVGEELRIVGAYTDRMAAILNDDSSPVGQVHLGIVHIFEVETRNIRAGEAAICDLEFLSAAQLRERRENLETWSQIVLDSLDKLLKVL